MNTDSDQRLEYLFADPRFRSELASWVHFDYGPVVPQTVRRHVDEVLL